MRAFFASAKSIFTFTREDKIIFAITVLLRLAAFGVFVYLSLLHQFDFPVIGSDSRLYMEGRESLIIYKKFLDLDTMAPMAYILPGYPLFITLLMGIFGHVWAVSFAQHLLAGIIAVMIFRIGIFFSKKIAWTAALLFALDPAGIFYSGTILTETLFLFFFVAFIYVLFTTQSLFSGMRARWLSYVGAGALLGMATMARPVGVIFVPGALLFLLLIHGRNWQHVVVNGVCFVAGVTLFITPWLIRNNIHFGAYEISPVASLQYYAAHAPLFYAWREGIPEKEAILLFRERLIAASPYDDAVTIPNAPYMRQVAFDYIGAHPIEYASFHVAKSLPLFISDGLRDITQRLHLTEPPPFGITTLLLRGDIASLKNYFSAHPLSLFLLVIGTAVWIVITLCAAGGVIASLREAPHQRALLIMFLIFLLAAMVVAGGATAHPRYRHSISPLFFLLAAYGFWRMIDFWKTTWLSKRT